LIASHSQQNRNQILEIAAIFERHGEAPGHDKCKAMEGLIEGGTAHLEQVRSPQIRDLMMIAHCLRIDFYETAAYGFTALLDGRVGLACEPAILSESLTEEDDLSGPQACDIFTGVLCYYNAAMAAMIRLARSL